MIALALLINVSSIAIAYVLGTRHSAKKPRKPKPSFCDLTYTSSKGVLRTCKAVHTSCVSGLCKNHCKECLCNCYKAMTKEEKAILDETRKALTGE